MAWKSHYRENDGLLSPRTRALISRAAMAVLGGFLLYLGIRGLGALMYYDSLAATQPAPPPGVRTTPMPIFAWVTAGGLACFGAITLFAAAMPIRTMQRWFERFNRPPITGERGSSSAHGSWWDVWT